MSPLPWHGLRLPTCLWRWVCTHHCPGAPAPTPPTPPTHTHQPPSCSQEPPDFFLCSPNIPFARGVSEFSKPGPWACLNKSLPHPPSSPPPLPSWSWGRCHLIFPRPCLGCWALPRERWPWPSARRQCLTPRGATVLPWGRDSKTCQVPGVAHPQPPSLNRAPLCPCCLEFRPRSPCPRSWPRAVLLLEVLFLMLQGPKEPVLGLLPLTLGLYPLNLWTCPRSHASVSPISLPSRVGGTCWQLPGLSLEMEEEQHPLGLGCSR